MADRLVDSTCGLRLCQGFLRLSKRQRREGIQPDSHLSIQVKKNATKS